MTITAGAGSDLMSDLLRGAKEGVVVLSGLNNLQLIRTSIIAGAAAVVIVRAKWPDEEMIAQAKMHDLPLLTTPFTMFVSCGRLFFSPTISRAGWWRCASSTCAQER